MKGYWQGEKKIEREIGRPVMNSNSEKAQGNIEIEHLTAEHGKMEERRKREREQWIDKREKKREG